ncbi:putative immunoglobulin-blocking virulence protein [Mycoplasma sp. 'Moose RK']|uniref:putative immunoglobulin-blocking virulence protein n=1 Tax=Mycoplasma sp. 'Moose RK' TaxID=2780095 RepID=UPI0018C1E702|nr:putative immunoglobulin-blocking virulence protein [Mycoplasma sp. 'Moose RK']MBG0730924.1 putative immunoglobulin-blocking virulence protein [Mycoplasma sp. 'Moose RK']
MIVHLTRRRKYVVAVVGFTMAAFASLAIKEILANFDSSTIRVSYSTAAPSTIAKNRPNDTGFNSPVANSKFVPPKPVEKKPENPVKPEIIVPKVEKVEPLPEKIKKIEKPAPAPAIESVTPIQRPSRTTTPSRPIYHRPTISKSQPIPKTQFRPQANNSQPAANIGDSAYQRALGLWRQQADRKINEVRSERDKYAAQVAEQDRILKDVENHWKTYGPTDEKGKPKVSLEVYIEGVKYKRWVANNYREREDAYLKVIEQKRKLNQPFTADELQMIKDGYTPDPATDGWEPKVNVVVNNIKKNNARRLNAVDSKWTRYDGTAINSLKYDGWDDSDASSEISEFIKDKGFSSNSIVLKRYTRKPGNTAGKYSEFKTLILNADDDKAFEAFAEIMKKAAEKDQKIMSIVLKNVGAIHKTQNIKKILELLPKQMQKVSLFLDDHQAINGLRGLEKFSKLTELELYSNSETNESNWAINPNALKNVDFISFDYINKGDIKMRNPGEKIAGSIIFDTLRWDEGDTTNEVNEGLKIAFGSKIDQRVFQGTHGGRGGYPINLDFSSSKKIKTLKGINFGEIETLFNQKLQSWEVEAESRKNPAHVTLKFQYLYFGASKVKNSSNSNNEQWVYKVSADDFQNSQFTDRLVSPPPLSPGIYVKDDKGKNLTNIPLYITGTSFSGDALSQLQKFVSVGKSSATFGKIYVEKEELKSKLSGLGLSVETKQITVDDENNKTK